MVQDQYYHIEAHFAEATGGATVKFYWAYSGQSKIIVPSEYWYYPRHVASSPYTVSIPCPSGYTGTNSSNPNVCSEICGDGKKVGDEVCDDGDTSNANGCSSDCRSINLNWVCIGGTPNQADTCTE